MSGALQQKVDDTFDELSDHFSDRRTYYLNAVVVPSNDGRYRIAFRRDAFSDDRLILEFAFETCDPCPPIQARTGQRSFFEDQIPCVVAGSESGNNTGKVVESTRCHHFVVKNSPKALAEALVPLQAYLSDDATRRLYGVQKKFQDRGEEMSYPLGERLPFQSVISGREATASIVTLSDEVQVRSPEVSPWAYGVIALLSVALLVAVAFLVRYLLQKYTAKATTKQDQEEAAQWAQPEPLK